MAGSNTKGAAWNWRRLALGAACVVGLGTAGYVGSLFVPRAKAQPEAPAKPAATPAQPGAPAAPADYSKRPVAFLHNNEVVTREQLGEYLIARFGADRLPLLVNKIIIEEACKAKGIEVTPAEVEVSFAEDLASMNMDEKTFVAGILKNAKKSLYEWKEDVVRPKLLMTKLVRDRVTVTEDDIKAGYDAYYGEKVEVQIIYWPHGERQIAIEEHAKIRDNDDEFQRKARTQADSRLAATQGHLDGPIGHHTTGSSEIEKAAFSLHEGEVSALIETPDGIAVIKCLKRIPANTTVSLE
ncbi:MAG TPA: peptidylprolyl isomerase, partial [Gemmataceae bacterium]|nr:peptidylprolyl isomerase [Gemmataceae bacterium]